MPINVAEMQKRIAGIMNLESTAPTEGSREWNQWLLFLNMAQTEAFELYDWQFLYKEYQTNTSTSTGNTSISLPADYRKLSSYPNIGGTEYAEVRPQERNGKDASEKYVYVMGNSLDNYTMVVHTENGGNLASGTTVRVPYYSSGGSLVSGSDYSMIPDAQYLVARTVAYIWESREDDKFAQAKLEADLILRRLLERENVFSEAANDASRVRTIEETRFSFRIGRD